VLPTVGQFLREASTRLAGHSPTPRLDAEVLVMHVCGLSRAELLTHAEVELCETALGRLQTLLAQRATGEPLAYLTGAREFWSLPLRVTADVLIPRPETELLVERVLAHIPAEAGWSIADLGTGSGAIAIAIARERPRCRIVATDQSPAALTCARENTQRHGLANIEFRQGDWCEALGESRFDLIVSNPPYVCAADPHLEQGDVRFEPRSALVAGTDGLDAIRAIAASAPRHLKDDGVLLLEHGRDQAAAVGHILIDAGFRAIVVHRDLAGLERVTEARRAT
jgi:release factor glutamine methyltransferase